MGRPRDPRRDAAKDLFLARRGNITTKELAEKAGVPDSTILSATATLKRMGHTARSTLMI